MNKDSKKTSKYKSLKDAFKDMDSNSENQYAYFIDQEKTHAPAIIFSVFAVLVGLFGFTIYRDLSNLPTGDNENPDIIFSNFELNRNSFNIQEVISKNANFEKIKEQIIEEQDIIFESEITDNPSLPKDEEFVVQAGVNGRETVLLVKTYENGNLLEELIIEKTLLLDPITEILEIGTSEFLAKHNVHIGDTMYLTESSSLLSVPNLDSNSNIGIAEFMDVTLLELVDENICKISFDNLEGYVPTSLLTSSSTSPSIVEQSRMQRIRLSVNSNMPINQSSGLSQNDFKTIFTNLPNDYSKIMEANYSLFYELDEKYNINGIALAAIVIEDTNYGTNLNGLLDNSYSFDGWVDAEEHSITSSNFSTYLEALCKILVLDYVYPLGVNVFNSEYSTGTFYMGSSITNLGMNYNNTPNWAVSVYSIISTLYGRL